MGVEGWYGWGYEGDGVKGSDRWGYGGMEWGLRKG